MTPTTLRDHLAAHFGTHRPRTTTERDLQDAIEEALRTLPDTSGQLRTLREHALTRRDRPDFYVFEADAPGVAIEVKTKGGLSDLTRQVFRYAELPAVGGVLVVTTRNLHRNMPSEAMGKPVAVLCLSDYLL